MAQEKEVLKKSDKSNTPEAKKQRSAQSVGKVFLNKRKTFEITKDTKHFQKGDKVKVNRPTEELFRAKGIIK